MTNIRTAQISDLEFIVASQIAMARETEDMQLDLNTVRLGVKAVLDDANKGLYYIATLNNQPQGMLLTIPEWSDWRNGTVLWIHSVYIFPEFRKNGVYAALYNHLKDKVQNSKDYRGLRLYVDKRNLAAQKVYEKLGMSKEHYELYEWLKA